MSSPQTCPLCGGPNGCAIAACGSVEAPCWCRTAAISEDVLAQVPSPLRGLACICARCVAQSAKDPPRPLLD